MDLGLDANAVTPSDMGRCWRVFQEVPPPSVRWAWLLTGLRIAEREAFPWVFDKEEAPEAKEVPEYGPVD